MRRLKHLFAAAVVFSASPLLAVPVALPVDGLDTADVNYTAYESNVGGGFGGISDATSLGPGGGGDHFDHAFGVAVDGQPYSPDSGDLTGTTLSLNPETLGQFDVSVSLRTTGPLLRQIVTVTNNGPAAIASVSWHNNTGNDGGQQTIATSDGDLAAETTDRWIVTADNTVGDNNEVNSWVLFGPDSPFVTPSTVALVDGLPGFGFAGEEGLSASFQIPLVAGASASLLWFVGVEGINQDGIDLASQFDSTATLSFNELIADLNDAERLTVVNWNLPPVPEPATAALLGLGLALFKLRRR